MKIYITTHGLYEDDHISLCTTDFKLAVKHFLDYSKKGMCDSKMGNIDIWENNIELLSYGSMIKDIVNSKKKDDITYEDIEQDILKQLNNL